MLEIRIDGRQLHITHTDVTVEWTNIRFSSAIQDEWSTEITLPNDSWNIDLLGAYGLLDRGALFTNYIKCGLIINDIERDGYLQVLDIEENEIHIRLFVTTIPYEIVDKKVSEYFPDDIPGQTIFRWDRYITPVNNIAGIDCGIIRYNYTATDYYSNILAQWHPSVSVASVLGEIQTAEDITLPAVPSTWFQLSAKKVVCPQNPNQCIMGWYDHNNAESGMSLPFGGGQHITNDLSSDWSYADFKWNQYWTDWSAVETAYEWVKRNSTNTKLTFDRACTAHIRIYAIATKIGGIMIPRKNGNNLQPGTAGAIGVIPDGIDSQDPWDPEDYLLYDDYVSFADGDEFDLHYSGSAQVGGREVFYSVTINYSDYDVTDEDYDRELTYLPAPFGVLAKRKHNTDWNLSFVYQPNGDGFGQLGNLDYCFCYIGAWSSLDGDMSVRDYITSLCWTRNNKTHLDKNELIFQSANVSSDIEANIIQIIPTNEKLGQLNVIKYRDSEEKLEFEIDNDFLETEMTIFESVFATGDPLPQYSYETTYREGTPWVDDIKVDFEDLGAVLLNAEDNNGVYWLRKAPDIIGFGLADLNTAMTVKARAFGRLAENDYVYINGHKYMMVGGSYDPDTDITEFDAIQCYNAGPSYEPTLGIYITGHTGLTNNSVNLKIQINET